MRDIHSLLYGTTINTREQTDTYFLSDQSFKNCSGLLDSSIQFVLNRHIKNTKMWKLFVNQYRCYSDSVNNGWRGEFWGKMMRGAVEVYKYTNDDELYDMLTESVKDMLTAQDKYGRFSTYAVYNEFGNWDLWCRKYVMLGFEYFYDICKDGELKSKISLALCRHLDYIIDRINAQKCDITYAGIAKLKGLNSASILEPTVRLYNITGNERYLNWAKYIVDTGAVRGENIFKCVLKREKYPYELSVTKAYEMMSCFEGLIELYRATNTEWYLQSAMNFADMIYETDITVIGGSGCHHEFFDNSVKTQTDTTITLLKNETCVTVTWIKLCAQLLLLTGEAKYAEWIEKSGYNALLGAVNTNECLFDFESHERYRAIIPQNKTENGITDNGLPFDSYSPLLSGQRGRGVGGLKPMQKSTYYGCCASIGAAGLGLFGNLAAIYSKDGIVLNFYNNGTYKLKTPKGQDATVSIISGYPASSEVGITVLLPQSEEFALYIRVPEWCGRAVIGVNGDCAEYSSGYCKLTREWHCGDSVNISLCLPVTVNVQDGFASVRYGALTLARDEQFGDNIDEPICIEDIVCNPCENDMFDSQVCFEFESNGKAVRLCDYASAGKNWNNGKRIAAWFPII